MFTTSPKITFLELMVEGSTYEKYGWVSEYRLNLSPEDFPAKAVELLAEIGRKPMPFVIFDFACPTLQIAIEIDGSGHRLKKQAQYDRIRDGVVKKLGWRTIRWNEIPCPKQPREWDWFTEQMRRFKPWLESSVNRALATMPTDDYSPMPIVFPHRHYSTSTTLTSSLRRAFLFGIDRT